LFEEWNTAATNRPANPAFADALTRSEKNSVSFSENRRLTTGGVDP
jgi:hypothetical protein